MMEKKIHAIALLAVILMSTYIVYDGLFNKAGYFLPTFDNSMLHAGRARVVVDTGHWAEMELVFGGITKSYHLPLYPDIVAGLSALTGLNVWWAVRLAGLLITGLLLPLSIYLLAKQVSGSWQAGVIAALVTPSLPSIITWGTRTSPISLGVVLVAFGIYFLAKEDYWLAGLAGLAVAFTHQPSLLAFGLGLFIFFGLRTILQAREEKKRDYVRLAQSAWPLFAVGSLTLGVYLLWHLRQTGFSCLDFKCLPHLASHEYGTSVDLAKYLQLLPRVLAVGGVALVAISNRFKFEHKLLLFSWLAALLILVKNDMLGIGVFTERFLTFFDEALAVFAGLLAGWAYALASEALEQISGRMKSKA
jgi:hypothetical protein